MSTSISPDLQAVLEQIDAEWKAFQIAHKMLAKHPRKVSPPETYGQSYGQGRFWNHSDWAQESVRLNELDRNKP